MRAGMTAWLAGLMLVAVLPRLPAPATLWGAALTAAILLCGSALWRLRRRSGGAAARIIAVLAISLFALAYSGLRAHRLLAGQLPQACNREALELVGVVTSLPAQTLIAAGLQRQRFGFRVERLLPAHCRGPRHILLSYYGKERIRPGERWHFSARLQRPWGLANPGSYNVQSWYAASAIQATGSVHGEGVLLGTQGGAIGRLRQRLAAGIDAGVPGRAGAAVVRAVTVGDKSAIDHRLWTLCQHLGINHLLVISGLHVAMVGGLCWLFGRCCALPLQLAGCPRTARWLPPLGAIAGALAYSALAGFALPCVRALCMLAVFLLARLAWLRSSALDGLLLAACVLLVLNPFAVLGSGFWLSFGAVAGLFWLDQWRRSEARLQRSLRAHSLMAGLMLPAGALWFGGASLLAVAANLLLVPLVGLFVVPLCLAGALLWTGGLPQAEGLWQLAAWPLEWGLGKTRDALATERLYLFLPGGSWAALLAVLAVALATVPLRPRWRCATLLLLLPLWQPARTLPPGPSLHVLDVGQGTAVIYSAGDRILLYDTGGGNPSGASLARSVILPWLRLHGVSRLDVLVVSHGDFDHSGGAEDLLRALPVGRLWAGADVATVPAARHCLGGREWHWPDGSRFRFLSPLDFPRAGNDGSCVLQIEAPGMRILLPGDIGQEQERALVRRWGSALRSDVLLAGHHGSNTSTAQSWLNHVDPALVIVAAGYASRFGHPHPAVIRRLDASGIAVRQTALEGTLVVRPSAEGGMSAQGWREQGKTWWK